MRVALLSCSPLVSPERSVHVLPRFRGLAGALARAGHEVVTLAAGSAETLGSDIVSRELRTPVTAREIDWHFSHVQPELVLEFLTPGSADGVMAAGEAGIPLLYDVDSSHVRIPPGEQARSLTATAVGLALSAGATVSTDADAGQLRELAGPILRIEVVADGVGPESFLAPRAALMAELLQRLRLAEDEWCVGFAGPVTHESQVMELVSSLGGCESPGRTRLMLLGDGPARNDVLRAACDRRVSVTLCGRIPHEELPGHFRMCDLVVAGADGAESAMVQAMAAGRAVVALAAPCAQIPAHIGSGARWVPGTNGPALTLAIRELLVDEMLRTRMGAAGRRHVEEHFTWDSQAVRLVEFASSLAAKSRAV